MNGRGLEIVKSDVDARGPAGAHTAYADALRRLSASGIPFLVGGAFAMTRYVGIERDTKDLDVFVRPDDAPRVLALFRRQGRRVELTFPHWLGKVFFGREFMDVIFNSGNGIARVDDRWFAHARDSCVLGVAVRLCPPEEVIWSKAYVQERERFDGADVIHLLRDLGPELDWRRLLDRFGAHWRVLLSHVVTFGFVYPDLRHRIPAWVVAELGGRFVSETADAEAHVCNGTLLSREQYLADISAGYQDARMAPIGRMTPRELDIWAADIAARK